MFWHFACRVASTVLHVTRKSTGLDFGPTSLSFFTLCTPVMAWAVPALCSTLFRRNPMSVRQTGVKSSGSTMRKASASSLRKAAPDLFRSIQSARLQKPEGRPAGLLHRRSRPERHASRRSPGHLKTCTLPRKEPASGPVFIPCKIENTAERQEVRPAAQAASGRGNQ